MTTSAPPTYISAQNQNGVIAIVTGFSLCVVLLSVGVRLYARRYASAYRWDDAAFYATAALGVGQIAVGLYMVGKGLGKTVMELGVENFLKIRNAQIANHILYVAVLYFSKLSCALMFLWLTPYAATRRMAWVLIGCTSVWGVTSVFIEGFDCDTFPKQCPSSLYRWIYIAVGDVLIESALIATAISIVARRQMSLGSKCTVVGAFSCRLLNIALTIIRVIFIAQPLSRERSPFWTSRIQSATQISISYTITSCVIPYLRPLMQAYENEDGTLSRSPTHSLQPSFTLSKRSSRHTASFSASPLSRAAPFFERSG